MARPITDRATKESPLSATDSPRPTNRPTRSAHPDPNAIDLAWAMGRARNWLLGPAPLLTNLSLFLFVGLGTLLWRLSQQPDGFSLPAGLVAWGVLIAIHAGVVVAWGTVHAVRTPRRGPVYYQDIPQAQRTVSHRSATVAQSPLRTAPVEVARPTWQGALAPVTPFPTRRGADRFGTSLPPAPDHHDISVSGHLTHRTEGNDPFGDANIAPDHRESALVDARGVLASEQPLWRRWRRSPARAELAEPPVDSGSSWLSPFPGARPVTRPAPATPPALSHDGEVNPADRPATDRRWPTSGPSGATTARTGQAADSDQIPSLAAMLRSSNLTSLADAPIAARPSQPSSNDGTPVPLPSAPILFSRPSAPAGVQSGTSALFAAFGIDGDRKPARTATPDSTTETPDPTGPATPQRSDRSDTPAPRRPERS